MVDLWLKKPTFERRPCTTLSPARSQPGASKPKLPVVGLGLPALFSTPHLGLREGRLLGVKRSVRCAEATASTSQEYPNSLH